MAGRRRRELPAAARERRSGIDDPEVVLNAAARFLEARPRSVAEVRRRLTGAGYRTDLVDGAIDRLLELGMLDDQAFAEAWVASRDRVRPRGERALQQELRQKGIDRAVVDQLLETRRSDEDGMPTEPDRIAAQHLIARNARALARVADPRLRRQRAYALLARNGFDPETCREVAARVDEQWDGEAPPELR
jgi:regulatory protein